MEKLKRICCVALLVIFAGIFLVSAFTIGRYVLNSKQQSDQYNSLAEQVEQIRNRETNSTVPTDSAVSVDVTVPYTDPETDESPAILPEYAGLYLENPDLVGWLCIPDTKINYPVMQSPDEPDYYLHRNFYREENSHGALYVREECDVFAPSDNLTIYGHHMQDGSMFGSLVNFKSQNYWESHKTLTFDTLTEHHTYEIFAAFTTTASVGEGFDYHHFVDAADETEYDEFVAACKALSHYDTGITPVYGDKLICLSTCEYSRVNGRFVVVARRIS